MAQAVAVMVSGGRVAVAQYDRQLEKANTVTPGDLSLPPAAVTCVHIAASDTLPISPVERWTVILTRARGWRQSRHDLQSARTLS